MNQIRCLFLEPPGMLGLRSVMNPVQLSHITADAYIHNPVINHHHVSVVVSCKTGRVLSSGTNCATARGSIHAEMQALRQFQHRLRDRCINPTEVNKGVTLMSLRIAPGGHLILAKPCENCYRNIIACPHVKSVEWSDQNGEVVCKRCL